MFVNSLRCDGWKPRFRTTRLSTAESTATVQAAHSLISSRTVGYPNNPLSSSINIDVAKLSSSAPTRTERYTCGHTGLGPVRTRLLKTVPT